MDLIKFLTKYGINETTNYDLKNIADDLGIEIKVLMRDELNKINKTKKDYIIMNLETSKDNGSHWVSLSKFHNIYFDPYGILPTKEVYNYFNTSSNNKIKDKLKYNKIQLQKEGELCGQLSLYVLYCLHQGLKFEYIISSMHEELSKFLYEN